MNIDGLLVREARDEIFQALKAIAMRHGLRVEQQHSVTYSQTSFSIKYTFSDANIDINKVEFEKNCLKFGLQPKHYGISFKDGDNMITITGLSTRSRKYPILFTQNGKPMKMGAELMRSKLQKRGLL